MDIKQILDDQQKQIDSKQRQIEGLFTQCKTNVNYQKNFKDNILSNLSKNFQNNLTLVQDAQLQILDESTNEFDEKLISMLVELQDLRMQSDAIQKHNEQLMKHIDKIQKQCDDQLTLYELLNK